MLYFANPCSNAGVAEAMREGVLGYIDTPAQGNARPDGVKWCADNGAFSNRFNVDKWWDFLQRNAGSAGTCLFATAPDVVGSAEATLLRSRPWLSKIRSLGYPVAFVAQNRQERLPVPWDEFDALFLGGSLECLPCDFVWPSDQRPQRRQKCPTCEAVMTEWKEGAAARELVAQAKLRGKWVHMGRVNSNRRYQYAVSIGCDSVDGTFLTFGPDKNFPRLMKWINSTPTVPTSTQEEAAA